MTPHDAPDHDHTNLYGRNLVDDRHLTAYVNRGILRLIAQCMPANNPADPRTEVPDGNR